MSNKSIDRRSFLKGAAASAAVVMSTNLAANTASAQAAETGEKAMGG